MPSISTDIAATPVRQRGQMGHLDVRDLQKHFRGVWAVDRLSFTLAPGELLALIGPNGSGKSTTLDCVSGLLRQDGGTVALDGVDITHASPHLLAKRGLVRTFQATRVFGTLTVEQNLTASVIGRAPRLQEWGQYLLRQDRWPGIQDRVDELIDEFQLGPVRERRAGELSYGQRKLIQLAATLVIPPRVLLLDEPVAGVNPTLVGFLQRRIERLRDAGISIVLVEHNLQLVTNLADRIVVLDHGVKIAEGDPNAVVANRQVQEAYFGH